VNFLEMEDSLSLDELLLLFDVTSERFKRNAEIMIGAMGGSIGGGEDERSVSQGGNNLIDSNDTSQLPIGLGHTIIEGE
jgi:hypothetical protein